MYMKTTTHTISRKVEVNASAAAVFDALTNWPEQSKWILGTSVKAVKQNGQGKGGTIIARTAVGPFGFNDPMTITVWEPPYRCDVIHTGKVVQGSGSFTVKRLGPSKSEFIWSEDAIVPFGFIGTIGWHIAKLPFGLGVSWSLRRFKTWVEKSKYNL
jgi:hypothetical protein